MHNRSLVISWIKNDLFELQRDGSKPMAKRLKFD